MPTLELDITVYCECGLHLPSTIKLSDRHCAITLDDSCPNCSEEKYEEGHDKGYDEGVDSGFTSGYFAARTPPSMD